jgi:hypothetical protein
MSDKESGIQSVPGTQGTTQAQPFEVLEWLPRRGFQDDGCNVYGCEETTFAVFRVGGGSSKNDTSSTAIKLCETHFSEAVAEGVRFMRSGLGR